MNNASYANSWSELATRLGTTRQTLREWRARFSDCPRKDGHDRHSVAAWKTFILEKGLRPGYHYDLRAPRHVPGRFGIPERREFLFDIMERLDAALADGKLDVPDYLDASANFLGPILETGRDWGAEIDEAGYLARCRELSAKAASAALTVAALP